MICSRADASSSVSAPVGWPRNITRPGSRSTHPAPELRDSKNQSRFSKGCSAVNRSRSMASIIGSPTSRTFRRQPRIPTHHSSWAAAPSGCFRLPDARQTSSACSAPPWRVASNSTPLPSGAAPALRKKSPGFGMRLAIDSSRSSSACFPIILVVDDHIAGARQFAAASGWDVSPETVLDMPAMLIGTVDEDYREASRAEAEPGLLLLRGERHRSRDGGSDRLPALPEHERLSTIATSVPGGTIQGPSLLDVIPRRLPFHALPIPPTAPPNMPS